MIIGVDEAGRGPVFGSMFVAALRARSKDIPSKVKDSKKLSNKKVKRISEELKTNDDIDNCVVEITASEVDAVNDMTEVSVSSYATAIRNLADGGFEGQILLDSFTSKENRASRLVEKRLTGTYDTESYHGADETYSIVSAASILAKAARERHVSSLREQFGEVGSGYPSDSTTRSFLRQYVQEHNKLPPFARETWKTSTDMIEQYKHV